MIIDTDKINRLLPYLVNLNTNSRDGMKMITVKPVKTQKTIPQQIDKVIEEVNELKIAYSGGDRLWPLEATDVFHAVITLLFMTAEGFMYWMLRHNLKMMSSNWSDRKE